MCAGPGGVEHDRRVVEQARDLRGVQRGSRARRIAVPRLQRLEVGEGAYQPAPRCTPPDLDHGLAVAILGGGHEQRRACETGVHLVAVAVQKRPHGVGVGDGLQRGAHRHSEAIARSFATS